MKMSIYMKLRLNSRSSNRVATVDEHSLHSDVLINFFIITLIVFQKGIEDKTVSLRKVTVVEVTFLYFL